MPSLNPGVSGGGLLVRGAGAKSLLADADSGNTADGDYSAAIGGYGNAANGFAAFVTGYNCSASDDGIAMGDSCTANGYDAVALGYNSTAQGDYSFAVGDYAIATGLRSVNLQGYYVSGFPNTYSRAQGNSSAIIAGWANQADALRSAIVGGQKQKVIAGAYDSFIGGGGYNEIRASAYESALIGGNGNIIEFGALGSVIVGGTGNQLGDGAGNGYRSFATGEFNYSSAINSAVFGDSNYIDQAYAATCFGESNVVDPNAEAALVFGTDARTDASHSMVQASGRFVNDGDAQVTRLVLRGTAAGAGIVLLNGWFPTQEITLKDGFAYSIDIRAAANRSTGAERASFVRNLIVHVEAGTMTVTQVSASDSTPPASWTFVASVSGYILRLTFTVPGGTTARCVAAVTLVECGRF